MIYIILEKNVKKRGEERNAKRISIKKPIRIG